VSIEIPGKQTCNLVVHTVVQKTDDPFGSCLRSIGQPNAPRNLRPGTCKRKKHFITLKGPYQLHQTKLMSTHHQNPRRRFLTKMAGALGLSMLIDQSSAKAAALATQDPAPDDWISKIDGKHKMVFDVPKPHGIFAFAWPKVFLLTNQATGTPEANSVVVLRHDGIPYAMEDRLWEKYKFGEFFGVDDHRTGKPALRNPMWRPKEGEFVVPGLGAVPIGINQLQDSGVIFCVCDAALTVNAHTIAGKMKLDGAAVRKDFDAGILPGFNIVPSGLWAIGRAQEKGCGYCFAG
jgi:hypothetical protein